jgi:uncharacterized SAM-binding protein YcdF (DUF218 family)
MTIDDLIHLLRAAAWSLLPPAGLFWSAGVGMLLYWRWRRLGAVLVGASVLALIALSLPITSYALLASGEVEAGAELGPMPSEKAAIVVLGGDIRHGAREYGPTTVGALSLERLRYAARLQRRTGLPILVTGGRLSSKDDRPLAALMAAALAEDFGVEPRWIEDRSRNTAENARFSAELLRRDGIETVVVVTHAWHMRRALLAFQAAGMPARPAPTLAPYRPTDIDMVIPSISALYGSFFGIHELAGRIFYRFAN